MLALPGASVTSVAFAPEGVVVGVRLRRRRLVCPCGWSSGARYDRAIRRWRHVDLGNCRLFIQAEIRRLECRRCGRVRTEDVPWARPGARHTRDVEDVIAWLVQRTDKTTTATLLRVSWEAVDHIVRRVVADNLDTERLENLYRVGVDEISYRRGHQYLTIVADHDSGRVVWVAKGKRGAPLEGFYEALGPAGRDRIQAVSMDLGVIYRDATRRQVPDAVVCFDRSTSSRSPTAPSTPSTKPPDENTRAESATGPGATPASPCAPAPKTSPPTNTSCSTPSDANAIGSGEPGNSKKRYATSTAASTPTSPGPT
jgi:transposase